MKFVAFVEAWKEIFFLCNVGEQCGMLLKIFLRPKISLTTNRKAEQKFTKGIRAVRLIGRQKQ